MTNAFKIRSYPETILNKAILKLSQIDRTCLLKHKEKLNKIDKPILILIYENKFEKKNILRKTISKLWMEFLSESPELHKYFNTRPIIAFKNGRNIKSTLISTKFTAPWHTKIN